jgi:hypothetical protein
MLLLFFNFIKSNMQQPLRGKPGYSRVSILAAHGLSVFLVEIYFWVWMGRKENQEFEKDKVINGVKIYFIN